jgi:hypothetical protein
MAPKEQSQLGHITELPGHVKSCKKEKAFPRLPQPYLLLEEKENLLKSAVSWVPNAGLQQETVLMDWSSSLTSDR